MEDWISLTYTTSEANTLYCTGTLICSHEKQATKLYWNAMTNTVSLNLVMFLAGKKSVEMPLCESYHSISSNFTWHWFSWRIHLHCTRSYGDTLHFTLTCFHKKQETKHLDILWKTLIYTNSSCCLQAGRAFICQIFSRIGTDLIGSFSGLALQVRMTHYKIIPDMLPWETRNKIILTYYGKLGFFQSRHAACDQE